jgi:hypothetical protein
MATAFDTPVFRFAEPFSDLPSQWLEAATRAISASAELYTEVLNTQAEATRALFAAYSGLGAQSARTGSERAQETTERAEETTERVAGAAARTIRSAARTTSGAAQRNTRRAASTTPRAAKPAAPAAKPAARAAKPAAPAARTAKPAARAATATAPPAAIPEYDGLTAEQVLVKLPEQPQTALAEIAAYEQAHEQRASVLQRIRVLSGPEPAPGYDALTAEDAQALVADGSPTLAAAVRDYERRHKDRTKVVEAAVSRAEADSDSDAS